MTEQRAKEEATRLQARGYSVIYVHDCIIARIDRPDWVERLIDVLVPDHKRLNQLHGQAKEAIAMEAWGIRKDMGTAYYQNIYRYRISEDKMTVDPMIINHMIRSKKDSRGYIVTPVKVETVFGERTRELIKAVEKLYGPNLIISTPRQEGKSTMFIEALRPVYSFQESMAKRAANTNQEIKGMKREFPKVVTAPAQITISSLKYGQCCQLGNEPKPTDPVYMYLKTTQSEVRIQKKEHIAARFDNCKKLLNLETAEIKCVGLFQVIKPVNAVFRIEA